MGKDGKVPWTRAQKAVVGLLVALLVVFVLTLAWWWFFDRSFWV